ncbi:PREDICTED: protein SERAC1 isoform X2 [Ceratosolen solmsi marchali]|uniref:Protein SERAC1 n=1 Tax=Ceratosolen solmsi marchali TaxID=326594 RepID=A0AAJ7E3D2_9HYME|nr:PREDICTED: protein SERAC1 isoform X2 [Ceratosolen solmsi marchali]
MQCGCWILYQIRQTSILLNSIISPKVLELNHARAQYIYINNPKFENIFMSNHANDFNFTSDEDPIRLSFISKWWKTWNNNLAFRLFQVAYTGSKMERIKAIHSLSTMKDLKDWQYGQISQMLDARTAVALARSPGIDLRFFLKPPYFNQQLQIHEIVEKVHSLLIKLNTRCEGIHPCLLNFINKKFQNYLHDSTIMEPDISNDGLSSLIKWDINFLQNCLEAILHHSSLNNHSNDIVDVGGLQILMNIYKLLGDNIDICALIAKILSNISLNPEYLEDIFRSGWIRILTSWSYHQDIRISTLASCALANLDTDDIEHETYPQKIYLLHPLHRVSSKRDLDVIFIHGLLGGVFVTWRQRDLDKSTHVPDIKNNYNTLSLSEMVDTHPSEFLKDLARDSEIREWQRIGQDFDVVLHDCPINVDSKNIVDSFFCKGSDKCMQQSEMDYKIRTQCWPKDWLPRDVPNLRILGINYRTNLSMWASLCPITGDRSTIKDRSDEFTEKLVTAGVGKRSIIWVCHSMGGLLVKKMLVEEWKNGDKNNLLRNSKGIIFYSTPHRGSRVAALNQTTQLLVWPSAEVQELREQSPQLLQLHEDFLKMLKEYNIEVISFGETKPTRVTALKVPLRFVNSDSADPNIGEFFEIPQDHLSICKPANR